MATFKPMRSIAPDYDAYPITFPKMLSVKIDGIRLCKYQGKVVTKSGKSIPNAFVHRWCTDNLPEGIDGELIVGPPNLETTYNTTFRGVMTVKGEPDFRFYAFDLIRMDKPADARFDELKSIVSALPKGTRIQLVEQTFVQDAAQLDAALVASLSDGYEGLILKHPCGMYKFGRSTAKCQTQLKLKPEEDYDAQVLYFEEALHNGNKAFVNEVGEMDRSSHKANKTGLGMVGNIWFRHPDTGEAMKVSAGKLPHAERTEIWNDQDAYLGKWFKYRSMTYGVKDAPRHGRFLCWRDETDIDQS